MSDRPFAHSLCALGIGTLALAGWVAGVKSVAPSETAAEEKPWVQVTAVTIEPATIHKAHQPYTATVTVQVVLHGEAQRDASAKVEVATYSADPPGNNVSYSKIQNVPLKESLTIIRFAAEVDSKTVAGKLIVAASIDGTTGGIRVKQPESDKDWHAELCIQDP